MDRFVISGGTLQGDAITSDLFGANFVTSFDRTDGSFAARVEMIGADYLRYPGGTVTELLFDPANPDANSAEVTRADGVTVSRSLEPLSDFLDYLYEADRGGLFVIPTLRYLDAVGQGSQLSDSDIAGLRHYIGTVLSSGVEVKAFELGNEFMYLDGFDIPSYAQIAGQIALIADEEIRSFEASTDLAADYTRPLISLQSTLPWQMSDADGDGIATAQEAMVTMIEALPQGALEVITGLSAHRYISGAYEGIDHVDALWSHLDQMSDLVGRDLPVLLSEWNIKSNQLGVRDWNSASEAERDAIDTGLKHAGALAAYFHEIAANDVEFASIWGLQHQNQMSLAAAEGSDSALKAGGVMMQLLQDLVIGTHAMEIARPDGAFDIHGFGGAEGQVFVINSRMGDDLAIELDLTQFVGSTAPRSAQILGVVDGADPRDPNAPTTLQSLDPASLIAGSGVVLHLAPYEVLVLDYNVPAADAAIAPDNIFDLFSHDPAEIIAAEIVAPQSDAPDAAETENHFDLFTAFATFDEATPAPIAQVLGHDQILAHLIYRDEALAEAAVGDLRHRGGSAHDDGIMGRGGGDERLFGRGGHDTLWGARGADALFGGVGSDALFGGQGDDLLHGGAQHDRLFGDAGNDLLFGGSGSDHLEGGAGDDLLSGGAGFDRFIGGEGRDVFFFDAEGAAWRETIVDFNAAEDRLAFQLEGLSVMEALSLSREETDLIVNYGLGSVVLAGQAEAELTEDHFLFV